MKHFNSDDWPDDGTDWDGIHDETMQVILSNQENADKFYEFEKLYTQWLNYPRKQMGSRPMASSTESNETQVFGFENVIPLFRENKRLHEEQDDYLKEIQKWKRLYLIDKETIEKAVEHVEITKKHYEKIRNENPRLAEEYLDHIRFCNGLIKDFNTTKAGESE